MKSVAILEEYLPNYRAELFIQLRNVLQENDCKLNLLMSKPKGDLAKRGDASTEVEQVHFRQVRIPIGHREIQIPASLLNLKKYDLVIFPLQGSSFIANYGMYLKKFRNIKVAYWGHVKNYVKSSMSLDLFIEKKQMQISDHIFAYTESGVRFGEIQGIPTEKFTVLNNTIDTKNIEMFIKSIKLEQVEEFCETYALTKGEVVFWIGALDKSKRVDFLAKVLERLYLRFPNVKVVICGNGSDSHFLNRAIARDQVLTLGYAGAFEKAMLSKISNLILMPGRIGLVAVDSIALKVPILTTNYRFHAPEFEYLIEGKSKITVGVDDIEEYVEQIGKIVYNKIQIKYEAKEVSFSQFVANFSDGILKTLNSGN